MGSELKKEIEKHGGKPLYDEDMTDAEIIAAGFQAYKDIGEVPPPVKEAMDKIDARRAKNDAEKK